MCFIVSTPYSDFQKGNLNRSRLEINIKQEAIQNKTPGHSVGYDDAVKGTINCMDYSYITSTYKILKNDKLINRLLLASRGIGQQHNVQLCLYPNSY